MFKLKIQSVGLISVKDLYIRMCRIDYISQVSIVAHWLLFLPFFLVVTILSFLISWLIRRLLTRVIQWMPVVEQELLIPFWSNSVHPWFYRVALVFCVVFCQPLFVCLSFFCRPLYCLTFYLLLPITLFLNPYFDKICLIWDRCDV